MNYLPPPPSQSPPFDPLQRRLVGLAGLLAALMIALIVFHTFHTGETGLNAVAEAAERTARQPGAKLALEVTYTVEGAPGQTVPKTVVGNGGGAFDARTGRATATLTVPVPGRGSVTIDTITDERHVFMRSPMFASELPPGKEWLGMEPFLGHNPQTAFGSNGSAKSQLEMLKAIGGDVEKLDQQTVRGHLTTRYKGSVEISKAAELLAEEGETELAQEFEKFAEQIPAPIPVEVWIDDKGLARQIRITEPLPTPTGAPTVTMDMRMQFFAFGAHPKIKLPPKHAVFDFTPILRAELGLEDGSSLGSLTPPAGAKPLSVSEFRKRVVGVCHKIADQAGPALKISPSLTQKLADGKSAAASPNQKREATSAAGIFYERVAGVVRRAIRRLATVTPPPSLAAGYQRYLLLGAKQAEWTLTQGRAFQIGPSALHGLLDRRAEAKEEEAEGDRLEKRLGIAACGTSLEEGSASAAEARVE